jgi:HlyD family secretion protein
MRAFVFLALAASLALAGCDQPKPNTFEGYAEADYLYLSAHAPGKIATMHVAEGDQAKAGELLFTLDDIRQQAALADAKATLSDAGANAELAKLTYERTRKLTAKKQAPQAQLDAASAALDAAKAKVEEAEARLATANQDLADRSVSAPAAGRVEEVIRRVGERVGANEPVIALLPPARLKVRFFVPEGDLAKLQLGQEIAVTCDACAPNLKARISFIASAPQFTPPVIYSREERAKLVYLVEAHPEVRVRLRPGQPLEVSLLP